MEQLVDKLRRERTLRAEEYALLLENAAGPVGEYAARAAREVAEQRFGRGIFVRALIEITSFCRNDCYYCGLRRSNTALPRYRLTEEQIMACCRTGYESGFRTFVLQGGEDAALDDGRIERLVSLLRNAFPDCASRSASAAAKPTGAGVRPAPIATCCGTKLPMRPVMPACILRRCRTAGAWGACRPSGSWATKPARA